MDGSRHFLSHPITKFFFSQSTHIFGLELACGTPKLACVSFPLQSRQTAAVNNSESEMQAFSVERHKSTAEMQLNTLNYKRI